MGRNKVGVRIHWVLVLAAVVVLMVGGISATQQVNAGEGDFYIYMPAITSPRPAQIAFVSRGDGDEELVLMNVDGSGLRQLTFNAVDDSGPSWSPDGSRLVFHSRRDGYAQLYTMNWDGSNQQRLLNTTFYDEWAFWSPAGDKIAFARYGRLDGGTVSRTEVFVLNLQTMTETRLTYTMGQVGTFANSCWPSGWSPTGAEILYYCYVDGNDSIRIMSADGSNQRLLLNDNSWNAIPSMSPDGSRIVFSSHRDNNYEVYLLAAGGAGLTRLTNNPATDWMPRWSLDGTKILFESERDGRTQVYWMNPDGSDQQRLTDNTAYAGQAVWRP